MPGTDDRDSAPTTILAQATALVRADRLGEAAALGQRLVAAEPHAAAPHNLLGVIAVRRGDMAAAAGHFARAVACDDATAECWRNLGFAQRQLGRLDDAGASFSRALGHDAADAVALYGLAGVHHARGQFAAAVACYRKLLTLRPDLLDARYALACALGSLGDSAGAIAACMELDKLRPDYPGLQLRLGYELDRAGNHGEALSHYETAIAQNPGDHQAHANRGALLIYLQRAPEAAASIRRALELSPGLASAHSNLLLAMNYTEDSQDVIYAESLAFERQHALALLPAAPRYASGREPGRRLRVGYVSADFRYHSVAYFLHGVLAAHDRGQVEVFCYADVGRPDAMTAQLRALADHWRPVTGLDDQALARQVGADGIDILVDLAGHTAGNRLLAFARRPAPVQCTWLGYPNTTGLRAIGYRLTDAIADPPGVADAQHTETLLRLPRGFLCGLPLAVPALPAQPTHGGVTFGSFNTLAKLTAPVVAAWAAILHGVPGSRLLLKADALGDAATRTRIADLFACHGVAAERLELLPKLADHAAHLALYGRIDLALDSFPYNGTTTTFEALWMGVPVLALAGNRHAGRVGASILHHVGLDEWVADNMDDYVRIATQRAADRAALVAIRPAIRTAIATSPLADAASFTADLEHAYRHMWTRWCGAADSSSAQ